MNNNFADIARDLTLMYYADINKYKNNVEEVCLVYKAFYKAIQEAANA